MKLDRISDGISADFFSNGDVPCRENDARRVTGTKRASGSAVEID